MSASSLCPADETLAAFVQGELSPAQVDDLQGHLDGCQACLLVVALAGDGTLDTGPAAGLEHFELEGLIGRGGMGSVRRARDRRTGQVVAIKQLSSSAPDVVLAARFEREIAVLRQLDHPNIVRILGSGAAGGRQHLVMEYVAGGSLRQHLEAEPRWPVARTVRLLLELCDALARVHQLGVIHRDLKPENVLMASGGTPKLADFGLVQLAGERLTASGAVPGTLAYLSPEALDGVELDARADVWGLGVLAFELLAGQKPFRADTPAATLLAILQQAPPDLARLRSDVPRALAELVGRMLEKEPGRRIASVRQVAAALEAVALAGPAATLELAANTDARPALASALPLDLLAFIGREPELDALLRALLSGSTRLLTLLGPGGVGKSRLALELCRRLLPARDGGHACFGDGVFLVELVRLDEPRGIPAAVAEAIGFPFRADAPPLPQLCAYLRERRLLLLLDNFEHLLEGAELVRQLLEAAPGLCILVTSRERLRLSIETQFVLDGLSVPDLASAEHASSFSAVQLFVDAARRADPRFTLQADNVSHVVQVCSLVGGSPLGIVLAAAWIGVLSPDQLDAEMRRSLLFLDTDARDVPVRQRSLRAVYEHAWNRLPLQQQTAYAALSVFRGGFSRAAASDVARADLHILAELVHKSLVRPRAGARYDLHELLRQHAESKLSACAVEQELALERHARHYAEFLALQEQPLRSPAPRGALQAIESELGNVHAAWRWMVEHAQLGLLSRAADALHAYYDRKGSCADGEALFRAAAERLQAEATGTNAEARRLLGWMCCLQGYYCQRQARNTEARGLVQRGLELLGEEAPALQRARALIVRAIVERGSASARWVIELGVQATELLRAAGERWLLAQALVLLGPWLYEGGADPEQAEAVLRESMALQRELTGGVVFPLGVGHLGFGLVKCGRFEEGRELLRQALALAQQLEDVWSEQLCARLLAQAERSRGDYSAALQLVTRNHELARRYGAQAEMSWCSLCIAELEKDLGELHSARQRLEACPQPAGTPEYFTALIDFNLGDVALRGGQLEAAEPQLQRSLEVFERLNIQWAVAAALDALAQLDGARGRPASARERFTRALRVAREIRRPPLIAHSAAGLAAIYVQLGERNRAVEILGLIAAHPATEADTRRRRVEPLWQLLASELGEDALRGAVQDSRQLLESSLLFAPPA